MAMLFLSFFLTVLPAALAVKCYICSWSPKDATNRTVICSEERFETNAVAILECHHGCETYVVWDKNGVVEQVRRNCLQAESTLTEDCRTEESPAVTAKRCTCNANLCNTASHRSLYLPLLMLQLLVLWRFCKF